MSGNSDPALLRRLIEFELALRRESSELVEPFDWGRLVLNPSTSALWSDNYLELDSPGFDAHGLAGMADEHLGAHGIEHRFVVPADPSLGARLEPGFRDLGWEIERSVYMVLAREADREAGTAAQVPREVTEGLGRAVAEDDPDFSPEAVEQLPLRDARRDPVANGRWFAAPANRDPGAACVLYERGGIGQVEFVATRPERRGQGLATAVVLAAAEASRRAGHELTFIVADAEDWPRRLYARLGFEPVGEALAFLRRPDQPGSGGRSP